MRFSYHPLTSVVIAVAVWLGLLPLRTMLQDHTFLYEAILPLGVSAVVGLALAALRSPRALTLLAQFVGVAGVVAWRGLSLAEGPEPVAALRDLTLAGTAAIRTGVPPLEPQPGLAWLILLLTATLVLVVELLVNGLEQPAWAIAPLALSFGIAALVIREDLPWPHVVPALAGFLMVLASVTGVHGDAVGRASRATAHHLSRMVAAAAIGAAALGVSLAAAPLAPLGEKQPWAEAGNDGPIQLSDPTVRLEEDLRRPSDRPVLTYRTDDGEPIYLRTVALPELTTGGARLLPMRLSRFGMENAYSYPGDEVEVEVQMAEVPSEYLPVPFAVDSIDAAGNWSYDPDTMAVVASGPERSQQTVGLEYSVVSTVVNASRDQIAAAEAGADVDPTNTTIPNGLTPGVTELTAQVVASSTTAGEKALAIQSWLRSDAFAYTLDAPSTTSTDAISAFLTADRAGYCIHFAAAMITMARIEGIPARMAVGFTPGQQLEDGSYEVTSHDAHAWPELFLEPLGWVPFEPTPAFEGPGDYTDPADQAPAEPSPDPSAPAEPSEPAEPSPSPTASPSAPATPQSDPGSSVPGWVPALLWTLGGLVLLGLPALVRIGLRSWRLRGGQDPGAAADAAWREVEDLFVDHGRSWPHGSPVPAAEAASDGLPASAASSLLSLAHTVERSRFARAGAPADDVASHVRAVRSGLAETTDRWRQWRAVLVPPSLFRRRRPARPGS